MAQEIALTKDGEEEAIMDMYNYPFKNPDGSWDIKIQHESSSYPLNAKPQ